MDISRAKWYTPLGSLGLSNGKTHTELSNGVNRIDLFPEVQQTLPCARHPGER